VDVYTSCVKYLIMEADESLVKLISSGSLSQGKPLRPVPLLREGRKNEQNQTVYFQSF
jgi:hypothetical protein